MDLNITEEEAIFKNRSHPAMIQINTTAYVLEIIFYTLSIVFVPAYIFLSKFARRFHPLLRFQLRILFIEILVLSITRLVGVILRLIEAAAATLPEPLSTLRNLFTIINLSTVTQIDFSVFLIAMERLLATYKIKSYEKSYHSPILRIAILIYVLGFPNIINYYMHMGVLGESMQNLVNNTVNIVTTATYIVGILAMEASRILSNRQLKSEDRELSTSFQCKENLMSVAICFLLVPLLMLKNHANLTRFTKQTDVVEKMDGDVYFQTLMDKWK